MEKRDFSFENITIGYEIHQLTKKITLVQQVMYAAATWDFHRHHYDGGFIRGLGLKAPFTDGQVLGAFLAKMITDWIGPKGILKRLNLNYKMMVFPGDTITCKGKVTDKRIDGKNKLVFCELWIENQKGEKVVTPANAVIALP